MSRRVELTLRWLDGPDACIEADPCETVLQAAERAGVGLPFGCRIGACATCVGRMTAGQVRYQRPPLALKATHIHDGFVLLCIAEPRTDCRFEVGTAVQSQLVSNPWELSAEWDV